MSSYFKEYTVKLFKRHSRDLYITLILYFITMYFVSIRSEYASTIGTICLFVLIFIKKFESKTSTQPHSNSRNIEFMLLPFTAKEMFYAQLIKLIMSLLPFYLVMMGIATTILFDATQFTLLQFVCYESMAALLFFLINALASLRMNFVKIKKIYKLTSMTRFLNYVFVLMVVVLAGVMINKFYKTNVLALLIYFLAMFVFTIYLSFNVEKSFLHEHKIYKNKNFKWFDIPGAIIMLIVLISVFNSMTQPIRNSLRNPSSISKHSK